MAVIPKLNTIDFDARPTPDELEVGELALNAVSGRLYTKRTSGTVTLVRALTDIQSEFSSISTGPDATVVTGGTSINSSITGPTGSTVSFGAETATAGSYMPPWSRDGGTIEAVGRAYDSNSDPYSASISVSASDTAGDAYVMAANAIGQKIAMHVYGPDQPASSTYDGAGSNVAVLYSDTDGGLAIGTSGRTTIGQSYRDQAIAATFHEGGITTPGSIDVGGSVTVSGQVRADSFRGNLSVTDLEQGGANYGEVLHWNGSSWLPTPVSVNASLPVTSVSGRIGAIVLSKDDVGLDNVDNTSDADKPVSTATQAAIANSTADFVSSNTTLVAGSSRVQNIVLIPEADYLSLASTDPDTIYFLT